MGRKKAVVQQIEATEQTPEKVAGKVTKTVKSTAKSISEGKCVPKPSGPRTILLKDKELSRMTLAKQNMLEADAAVGRAFIDALAKITQASAVQQEGNAELRAIAKGYETDFRMVEADFQNNSIIIHT